MRMAVIALRNAADVRINIKSAVWPSASSLSRKGDMAKNQNDTDRTASLRIRRIPVKGWLLLYRRLRLQRRRRVVRQLVFTRVGALDFQLVEEQRRSDHRRRDSALSIAHQRIVADRHQVAPQRPHIQLIEHGTARQ